MRIAMTAAGRVSAVLDGREPDRVPFFLLLTMHGARELGLGIREYYASPADVAEGQLRMRMRYGHDCLYSLSYAAAEHEAFGGETFFRDDGPPTAGPPIVRTAEEVFDLEPPRVPDCPSLVRVIETIALLKERGQDAPIVGVVVAPFSLPAMQLGLGPYLEIMYQRPDVLDYLLKVNEEFCVQWGNAQFRAGAGVLIYFDPLSSPTMVEPELTGRTGFAVARRTLSRFHGPVVTSLASSGTVSVIEDLCASGTRGVAVGATEDMAELQTACRDRLVVIGNLNGLEMRRWDAVTTEQEVRRAITNGAPGGRFILADGHGEIPWQVPEEVLDAVAEAVRRWGRYPLSWVGEPVEL